jgi:colanic acid biosynthesis glycosyl transferase WcaI
VSRRRVILVNRYFHPDHSATSQLATDLARHLSSAGWEVIAIASRQKYDDRNARMPRRETLENLRIHRAWSTQRGRAGLAGRAIDYLTFALSAFFLILRLSNRRTLVIAMTDPPLLSVVAAAAAALRGARLVNWLQDLFPEVAEELGVTRRIAFLHAFRNWSLRRADVNVAVGERMAERLRSLDSSATVIHNWADAAIQPIPHEQNSLRRSWNLEGKFVVAYSGNLGRAHEIQTMAGAIRMLSGHETIRFLFIGAGARTAELRHAVMDLDNVRFEAYQPRERLSESLSAADVHLISLDPRVEGLIVPSKVYGILAAGRPAIFIGSPDGEIGELLKELGCGAVIAPRDVESLVEAILRLAGDSALVSSLGAQARAAHEERFTAPISLEAWGRTLSDISAV